jgi:hypothetical protein
MNLQPVVAGSLSWVGVRGFEPPSGLAERIWSADSRTANRSSARTTVYSHSVGVASGPGRWWRMGRIGPCANAEEGPRRSRGNARPGSWQKSAAGASPDTNRHNPHAPVEAAATILGAGSGRHASGLFSAEASGLWVKPPRELRAIYLLNKELGDGGATPGTDQARLRADASGECASIRTARALVDVTAIPRPITTCRGDADPWPFRRTGRTASLISWDLPTPRCQDPPRTDGSHARPRATTRIAGGELDSMLYRRQPA